MTSRPSVVWALLASVLAHAALVLGLSFLPGPAHTETAAAHRTSNLLYASEPDADNLPGDIGTARRPEFALTPGPIVVVADQQGYGPPLPATIEPGPAPAASGQFASQAGSGQSGTGSSGGAATTTFFGVPAKGQRFVYVLDRSGSMGLHQALATARRELAASLASLPPSAWFQVIQYNSTPALLLGRQGPGEGEGERDLVPATPDNIRRASAAMEALTASGTTKHLPALRMALALRPDVIYFLTDADDLDETDPGCVARLNAGHAVIHTIELTLAHRGWSDKPMQRLARENHGTYQAVDLFRVSVAGVPPG